jgi:hypothetical protein
MKNKILAMVTGRELDAFVAEKVFGLECFADKQVWVGSGMPHMQYWSGAVHYPAYWNSDHEQALSIPDYSDDIAAAWEVIEEMRIKGFAIVLQRQGDYFAPDDLWECQFGHKPMAKDESAQVAICKAALLAMIDHDR